jgi:hypothetical protein
MSKRKGAAAGGASTFEPAWLDAGPERARVLVLEANERGAELVEAWITRENAPAVLQIASDDHAPSPARKAARRGINVLKSRGVAIPELARAGRIAPASTEMYEAWFRPPDGTGTSAFTLGARSPQGRYRLVDVIMKSGSGLVSIVGLQMSRSQLGTTFDDIAKRFGHPPAPVPVGWARARIAGARAENDKSGTPVPLGFDTHLDLLGPPPTAAPPHPAETANLPEVERHEALARSGQLHAEPEVRGWLPEPAAVQEMLMEIGRSIGKEPGTDPSAAEAKVRVVIEKSTDEFFGAEVRASLAGRMKDASISMAARGARDRAADLVALAHAVGLPAPEPKPHEIPFLRAFFEKAFGLATARAAIKKGAGVK